MSTLKPYSGKSKDRLVELINHDNGTNLVEGVDFVFGTVESHSGNGGRNTRIKLIPTDTENYGEEYVNYYRLSINVLDLLPDEFIEIVNIAQVPFTIHSILDDINTSLGLDLEPSEVVNETHSIEQQFYPLKIRVGSFAWLPSTYNFKTNLGAIALKETGDPILMENGDSVLLEIST